MNKYYLILGISTGATKEEIKKAFRRLAHIHHPDVNGGRDAKFKEINEAYTALMKLDGTPFTHEAYYEKPQPRYTKTYTYAYSSQPSQDFFYKMYMEQMIKDQQEQVEKIKKMFRDGNFRDWRGSNGTS